MSEVERRLDKLFLALSAREQGILLLQAMKEHREEDPQIRWTMQQHQVEELNHYIFLMNSMNFELAIYLSYLHEMVDQLQIRLGWLQTLHLWALTISSLDGYIALFTKEPVTQSEYEQCVREAQAQMAPASELAEDLVRRHGGWTEADMEPSQDDDGEPVVSDAAWERVQGDKEQEIEKLVEAGVLKGKRKGRRLLVRVGSFYDWLGEPTPVHPDWGGEYGVFPDEEADKVRWSQAQRRHAEEMLERAPRDFVLVSPERRAARLRRSPRKAPRGGDAIAFELLAMLLEGVQALNCELRAAELVLEEVAAEFDGEDPLIPSVRRLLDMTRQALEEVRARVEDYVGDFELPEPAENDLERVRDILGRAERLYS